MKLTLRLLCYSIVAISMFACRTSDMSCPEPQVVKLKKSSAYRFHIFDRKQKEKVMAQSNSYDREIKRLPHHKELKDIDEWDCPRPGSQQDKLNQKRLKRIQKSSESNPRKVETIPSEGTSPKAN